MGHRAPERPINNMVEKKIKLNDAYSLKTPDDSIKLYKKWALTYDEDFALNFNYQSPKKISSFFIEHSRNTDTPILDVGAGTGLVAYGNGTIVITADPESVLGKTDMTGGAAGVTVTCNLDVPEST